MSTASPIIPHELIDIVAQHLIGIGAFGTCANLNTTSHNVYDATLKTLWTHMYWTAYRDPKKYNKEEVEEKWRIFKASSGAQYIRYMIQPPLFETSADFKKTPIISSSLSTTLKASVTLDQRGTYCTIQVHLYARYGYDMTDLEGLWPTLDAARSLPGFESISDITINVLSAPGEISSDLVGSDDVSPGSDIEGEGDGDEDDDNADASGDAFDPLAMLPPPDVDGWLKSINLNIDDSVKLEIKDYMLLSVHMMVMLRPYAVLRLEKGDEKMECAKFRMFGLQTDVLLAFSAAYMRLCEADPLYATLQVTFDLLYTEDDESDVAELQPEDVFGVLTLLALTAKTFKQASKTIPLKLLGRFLAWNEPEWFIASIDVNAEEKEMTTKFHYGYEDMINQVDKLEDVATKAAIAGGDARRCEP